MLNAMTNEQRPKIDLEQTPADRILEGVAAAGLLILLVLPAVYYQELPGTIPIHFNAAGAADGYGDKSMVWMLPLIGLGIYLMMTFINRRPHIFNYPVKITPENAEQQYKTATRLIRILKAAIMLLFAYICWGMIQGALSGQASLGPVFLWITLGAIFGTLVWYLWTAVRERDTRR